MDVASEYRPPKSWLRYHKYLIPLGVGNLLRARTVPPREQIAIAQLASEFPESVALETWEYNLAARRAYAKAGFREVGRRRQAKFFGGKFWDIVYMDCLASEFGPSPVLGQILVPDEVRLPAAPEPTGLWSPPKEQEG